LVFVLSGGNQDKNRLILEFFFPKQSHEPETGEIDLINGDVPRLIVKASPKVQVDRVEREEGKKRK
jgi:hypothetical protein